MSYYERHLPHWQVEGFALFLTWRLTGSLPKGHFLRQMASDAGRAFVRMDRILDAAAIGPHWLADECVAACLVICLRFGQSNLHLYHLGAWVLMSNHVHLLIEPDASLPRIMRAVPEFQRA